MTRVLEILTDWLSLASIGADAVTYAAMALLGTTLFVLRLVVAMFGDILGEFGLDLETDTDNSFTLFSLLSVMAFIMGTGWMGLACRIDWGLSRPVSAVVAVGFGAVMMAISSGLMYVARSLNKTVTYDLQTAVGRTRPRLQNHTEERVRNRPSAGQRLWTADDHQRRQRRPGPRRIQRRTRR